MAKKDKAIEKLQLSESDFEIKLEAVRNQINSKLKSGKLVRASELNNTFTLRRPTGITTLDLAIGGGFPAGGLVQLVGEKNSGKTYTAYRTCATLQETYGEKASIALLMVEPFDKLFAKKIGFHIACSDKEIEDINRAYIKISNRELTEEETKYLKHQVGNVFHALYPTAEDLLMATVDLMASNLFHIIVIDSIGAMQSELESEKQLDEKTYGGIAGVMTRFSKQFYPLLNGGCKTSIIAINQVRENINAGMFGNPLSIPGGKALAHMSMATIIFRSGTRLTKEIPGYKDPVEYGKKIAWKVEKGKCGCHEGSKGEFSYYYGEFGYLFGADLIFDLSIASILYDVVETSGSWILLPDGTKIQGRDKFAELLNTDLKLFQSIKEKIFEKAGIRFITKEEGA
jgi:RecA/RadA recombinase